jgi:hypothetical protein
MTGVAEGGLRDMYHGPVLDLFGVAARVGINRCHARDDGRPKKFMAGRILAKDFNSKILIWIFLISIDQTDLKTNLRLT